MMKWRRRKSGTYECMDAYGNILGPCLTPPSPEQLHKKENTHSPYEDVHLENLYKRFRTYSADESMLAELENSLELYKTNNSLTSRKQPAHQKSNEKHRLSIILPSIDEHDELMSIADSGISCDADDVSECEEIESIEIQSHYDSLKKGEDFNFGNFKNGNDSLLASITDELYKMNDLTMNNFELVDGVTISSVNDNSVTDNSESVIIQKAAKRQPEYFDLLDDTENTNRQSKVRNINDADNNIAFLAEKNLSDIEITNKQIFNRLKLKADLNHPLQKVINEPQLMPYALMSSMLWNGETSQRTPSAVEVYHTMPPNRYEKKPTIYLKSTSNGEDVDTIQQKKFKVNLDVTHYAPDEILVTLEDGKLVVNGKHFSESEYGFESCQFHRRYPIPDGIKKTDIKSKISEKGILTISGKCKPEIKIKPKRRYSEENVLNETTLKQLTSKDEIEAKKEENNATSEGITSEEESDFHEIDPETYQLKLNCNGYKPEDLDIKFAGRDLSINGSPRTNGIEGKQIEHKEFNKKFILPRLADPESITSKFVQNTLHIEVKKIERQNIVTDKL